MNLGLLADAIVAALLVATIGFCFLLNRRLVAMRAAEGEMRQLIGEFDRAIAGARDGIAQLKSTSEEAAVRLQEQIKQGRGLADDLAFLVERSDRLAARLAGEAAAMPKRSVSAPVATPAAGGEERSLRSEAERELAQALRRAR